MSFSRKIQDLNKKDIIEFNGCIPQIIKNQEDKKTQQIFFYFTKFFLVYSSRSEKETIPRKCLKKIPNL